MLGDTAKAYSKIEKQLIFVKSSSVREPKKKISQLQLDIQELDRNLKELGSSLKIFSNVSINPRLGTLLLQKELLKKHEAMNICFLNARKIINHINDSKLPYSLNRRMDQIKKRNGKPLDGGLATVKMYSHAGIEMSWEDGLLALYTFTSETRANHDIPPSRINHLAILLESSAVVKAKSFLKCTQNLLHLLNSNF